jgi:hypothetical protein
MLLFSEPDSRHAPAPPGAPQRQPAVRWAAGPVAVVCDSKPAARRTPQADDPEQDRPTQPGTLWVWLGAVAAWRTEGWSGGAGIPKGFMT